MTNKQGSAFATSARQVASWCTAWVAMFIVTWVAYPAAGAFSFHPAGTEITVANTSPEPAALVLIEVKD